MRSLYLTTMIFCHILLSSFIFYSTLTSASPVAEQSIKPSPVIEPPKNVAVSPIVKAQEQQQYSSVPKVESVSHYKSEPQKIEAFAQEKDSLVQKSVQSAKASIESSKVEVAEEKQPPKYIDQQQIVPKEETPVVVAVSSYDKQEKQSTVPQHSPVVASEHVKPVVQEASVKPIEPIHHQPEPLVAQPAVVKQQAAPVVEFKEVSKVVEPVSKEIVVAASAPAPTVVAVEPVYAAAPAAVKPDYSSPPAVKGGLGPLHLLAATLCSYQPHKPVSDETLTYLYAQRAAQRKNLFQFMSLKFTNLDKLTSHLNAGLEVTKTVDSSESSLVRSHGWPTVGNCTAHYLKLMAEAAWCDCADEPNCLRDAQDARIQQQMNHPRLRRSTTSNDLVAGNGEQVAPIGTSSVMSKLMYVGDVKETPVLQDNSPKAPVQPAAVASTRQCRRNALRLTKALFNHLAENQTEISESWPKLYTELAHDECARKRMIDIVTALSTFRSESTQVHRDNIEFAFAMDDLRGKVLENEVSTALTFDKQVIEVEQFLQQSVRLMLANIDPKRAKLTSMRYRSLHAPVSADDQCIELHQRLLAKNYPDDCNPNQYGPLPDVLRMAALSLDLWSIEQDLSKYSTSQSAPKQQDINECIANLVAN